MQTPIDATSTPAWGKLSDLKSHFVDGPHKLRRLFDVDSQRAERYTLDVADLHVDVSKNLLTDEIRDALLELLQVTATVLVLAQAWNLADEVLKTRAGEAVNYKWVNVSVKSN